MPLVTDSSKAEAHLYGELTRLMEEHSPTSDSFFYNGGTAIALLATGAATVLAASHPLAAATCSAIAAFVIAISRALNFGGRWRWHIRRQSDYNSILYRLNRASLLQEDERAREIAAIYDELIRQRGLDAEIPGSGEPVAEAPDRGLTAQGPAPT